jgi:DNA-binding beta-propeller fold protein YncE
VTTAPPGWLPEAGIEPEAVIREARRRQRRRWLAVAVATAVVIGGMVAVIAGSTGGRPRPPGAQGLPAHRHGPPAGAAHPAAPLVTVSQTRLPKEYSLSLAAGFGAVWLPGNGVTYQVDEATGRIVRTIPTPGTHGGCGCASSIAAGAGAVWVTHGCQGIYRIDPRTGRVTGSLRAPGAIGAIAAAGGLLWVTDDWGLLRIQPRTGEVIGKPNPVGAGGNGITPGAGALWLTSTGSGPSTSTVYRVDLATGAVTPLANPTLTDVQAVGAGSLWSSQVERVDPTGRVIATFFLLGPSQVVFWHGSAWALTLQRSLAFQRIDPATNQVTGTPVPLGKPLPAAAALAWSAPPAVIAAGPTGLWVLDYDRNLLFHLAMRPARESP